MHSISEKIRLIAQDEKYKQVMIFVSIGIINTMVDVSVSYILNGIFGVHYLLCQIAGYTAGTLNSFTLNKFITFRNRENKLNSLYQFIRFVVLNLVSLGATMPALYILINGFKLNFYISKVLVTLLSLIINFIGSKYWVFTEHAASKGDM